MPCTSKYTSSNNITKKVPITSKLKINFKVGYNLIEELKIIPDSIQISGPKISLDSISEISTNTLVLNEVYSNIKEVLKIKIPKIKNISMENSSVTIIGEVDKFTEGRFTFPVTIINKPEGVKISPFPKEIEVIYQAGLSNFSKIKKSNILNKLGLRNKEYILVTAHRKENVDDPVIFQQILDGLDSGDLIVIEGQTKLYRGAKVKIIN